MRDFNLRRRHTYNLRVYEMKSKVGPKDNSAIANSQTL